MCVHVCVCLGVRCVVSVCVKGCVAVSEASGVGAGGVAAVVE